MMNMSSIAIWIGLGLLATFLVLMVSLLIGFSVKAADQRQDQLPDQSRSAHWLRIFQRNKRRLERVPCDLVLEMRDRSEYVRTGSGRVLNLSNTGACVTSRVRLSLGEQIQGRIYSTNEETISISGRVVWMRSLPGSHVYGIQFR